MMLLWMVGDLYICQACMGLCRGGAEAGGWHPPISTSFTFWFFFWQNIYKAEVTSRYDMIQNTFTMPGLHKNMEWFYTLTTGCIGTWHGLERMFYLCLILWYDWPRRSKSHIYDGTRWWTFDDWYMIWNVIHMLNPIMLLGIVESWRFLYCQLLKSDQHMQKAINFAGLSKVQFWIASAEGNNADGEITTELKQSTTSYLYSACFTASHLS